MGSVDLPSIFLAEMALGIVGIERGARGCRVLTGDRVEELRKDAPRWLCRDSERARLLAEIARPQMRTLPLPIDMQAAVDRFEMIAGSLGVVLVTQDRLRVHAERAVATISAEFEAMKAAGELKGVNKSYREYRLIEADAGRKAIGYPTYITMYLANIVKSAAQHARTSFIESVSIDG